MQIVAATVQKGFVKEKFNDYSPGDVLPSAALDRFMEDCALLSKGIVDLHTLYHLPLIGTTTSQMPLVASADKITIGDNVVFAVGGVVFNTHDLDNRDVVIPDNSTKFVRLEVADDCGDVVAYETSPGVVADPLQRKIHANVLLVDGAESDPTGTGGGVSSASSMRVFSCTKGGPGTIPTVTVYANTGSGQSLPGLPAGALMFWATGTPPGDYLECNGATLACADYPALFSVLGYYYGGNGLYFQIPDWRGRFPRAWAHGSSLDPDRNLRNGGDVVGSTQGQQMPAHNHYFADYSPGPNQAAAGTDRGYPMGMGTNPGSPFYTANTGTGSESRPPNMAVMICIKWR
ncbi:MAG: tail fiber protein [Desulfovibrionaceae bacterium]|nr:tail fiber protein [Desulfovibrionaceae bacterium]